MDMPCSLWGGYPGASATGKIGSRVRGKYLKLHLRDELPSEDVGLGTYGIASTLGADSCFPIVPHVWTPFPEWGMCPCPVCPSKHGFALLTNSVQKVLWDFCACRLSLVHILSVGVLVGFLGLLRPERLLCERTRFDQDAFKVCGVKLRFV